MGLFRPYGMAALALITALTAAMPGTNAQAAQSPLIAGSEATAFDNEEFVAFAVTGVDDSCELIWTFTNTISTPPTHGTAAAGQAMLPYGELCPGKLFQHAVVNYTWTDTGTAVQDSLVTDVKYPADTRPVTVNIKRASVVVKSIDLSTGTAILDLNAGSDTSGKITFEFTTAAGVKSTQTTTAEYGPATGKGVTIDRTKIKKGQYTEVIVKWNVTTRRYDGTKPTHTLENKFTPPTAWNVLGAIRYSQYNVTTESDCTGGAVEKWVVNSIDACDFQKTTFKSDFLAQADVNGTGNSDNWGYVKPGGTTRLAKACKGKFPEGATKSNTYVHVTSVTGSCNKALVAGTAVATNPEACGAQETLVNRSTNANYGNVKKALDTCPKCNDPDDFRGMEGHIDSLTSVAKCDPHSFTDLGNYWTLQRP